MNLRRLAGNIIGGFFILLFLVSAMIIVAPFLGWHFDTVMSGSMEPTIPVGGMVILGPVAANDIHVGDIIAYFNGNVEVCHRVIAIADGPPARFTVKGDNNKSPDGIPVAADNVNGKLVVAVPLVGYLVYFMKTPLGLFLTILLPILFLIGSELKTLIFDEKEDGTS